MDLDAEAKSILSKNTIIKNIKLEDGDRKIFFTAPSPGTYNQQWFWDSCLHSLVWLKLGEIERASAEINSLYIGKQKRELIPHMIFWNYKKTDLFWIIFDHFYPTKKYSELIQPPIIGYSLLKLFEENQVYVKQHINDTYQYYSKLYEYRDPEGTGLISIIHPWESGLDSSPKFDLELSNVKLQKLRQWLRMRNLLKEFKKYNWDQTKMSLNASFRVKCVLTNTLGMWGMESFIDILDKFKMKNEKNKLIEISNLALESLIENCWNEKMGLFYDLNMNSVYNKQIKISTISSLIPLMLDIPKDIKNRLIENLTDKTEYWTKYPIPTVALSEKTFNPQDQSLLWRGPTWINTNYFIWLGLKRHKEFDIANEIALKSRQLVEKSGFREFYNPLTGEGGGAKNFGWSTLISLMEQFD